MLCKLANYHSSFDLSSSNLALEEHWCPTIALYLFLFVAVVFASTHVFPFACSSLVRVLLLVWTGFCPLFLLPCGFQSSAFFAVLPSCFLNVWPIHFLAPLLSMASTDPSIATGQITNTTDLFNMFVFPRMPSPLHLTLPGCMPTRLNLIASSTKKTRVWTWKPSERKNMVLILTDLAVLYTVIFAECYDTFVYILHLDIHSIKTADIITRKIIQHLLAMARAKACFKQCIQKLQHDLKMFVHVCLCGLHSHKKNIC